ncbi:MAG: hypothetical protein F4Z01_06885 [Gammaproteobacteria bacterium]|nr:hypothetical protein [Gammaproteobacteria bacterium]
MLAATKTKATTIIKKLWKIDGEHFDKDIEDLLDGITDRIIIGVKLGIKVFIVATIFMLIFGESRYIEDAPLMWRVAYEWKQVFNKILFQLFASEAEGGYFTRW